MQGPFWRSTLELVAKNHQNQDKLLDRPTLALNGSVYSLRRTKGMINFDAENRRWPQSHPISLNFIQSIVGVSFEQLPEDQTTRRDLTLNLRKPITQLEDPLDTISRLIFQVLYTLLPFAQRS